jgi:hypothetical protein
LFKHLYQYHQMSETSFDKLKLADLKALCKEKGLPVSGTKAELIQRLSGETPAPRVKKPTPKPTPTLQRPVFQKFLDKKPTVIKRNIHGHFEHSETRLVFSINKKIIGIQNPSGEIDPLTVQDLQNVYKYHFELEDGIQIQDQGSNIIAKDDSVKQQRVDELIEMTQ